MKICPICGTQFSDPKHPAAEACSKRCAGALSWRNRVAKGAPQGRQHPITTCVICGLQVQNRDYRPRKTCGSNACKQASRLSNGWLDKLQSAHQSKPTYKGGVIKHGLYLQERAPDHPKANIKGYVLQHRLVMERHIGRMLEDWEKVHHRNGVKDQNDIDNLEIVTHARPNGVVICPHCRKSFQVH